MPRRRRDQTEGNGPGAVTVSRRAFLGGALVGAFALVGASYSDVSVAPNPTVGELEVMPMVSLGEYELIPLLVERGVIPRSSQLARALESKFQGLDGVVLSTGQSRTDTTTTATARRQNPDRDQLVTELALSSQMPSVITRFSGKDPYFSSSAFENSVIVSGTASVLVVPELAERLYSRTLELLNYSDGLDGSWTKVEDTEGWSVTHRRSWLDVLKYYPEKRHALFQSLVRSVPPTVASATGSTASTAAIPLLSPAISPAEQLSRAAEVITLQDKLRTDFKSNSRLAFVVDKDRWLGSPFGRGLEYLMSNQALVYAMLFPRALPFPGGALIPEEMKACVETFGVMQQQSRTL